MTIDPHTIRMRSLLKLAAPLIFSMSGQMILQAVETIFLARYAAEAIAAAVPAAMLAYTLFSVFQGTVEYTGVLVAHHVGARQPDRVGSVVWQGLYLAMGSAVALMTFGPWVGRVVFTWADHAPEVRSQEMLYFGVLCWGSSALFCNGALRGFFAGLGRTQTIFIVQSFGQIGQAALAYVLIFGRYGGPPLGILGAALGAVAGQVGMALGYLALFLHPSVQRYYDPHRRRGFNPRVALRLLRYGFPHGLRTTVEMLAWTVFLLYVGRVGTRELAATNIAWRINGFAFFPILGLAQGVAILVGRAQGAERSDLAVRATWNGFLAGEVWMVLAALSFVTLPDAWWSLFASGAAHPAETVPLPDLGRVLLRFVALYCLVDAGNIVLTAALYAAGDTRGTLKVSSFLHAVFVAALAVADRVGGGWMGHWILATAFVLVQAAVWVTRFRRGRWRSVRLVDVGECPAVLAGARRFVTEGGGKRE